MRFEAEMKVYMTQKAQRSEEAWPLKNLPMNSQLIIENSSQKNDHFIVSIETTVIT